MTDRGSWVAGLGIAVNVRRLMYQSLIWPAVLGDEARRLLAGVDSEDLQGLADALVDGVRGDVELGRDFLGIEVLVDQAKAVELALAQPGDALRDELIRRNTLGPPSRIRHAVRILQRYPHPAQHYDATPEHRVPGP